MDDQQDSVSEQLSYFDTLREWERLRESVRVLQAKERELREGLFNGTFPTPREGANKVEFTGPDGVEYVLTGTYKLNRSVDEELWAEVQGALPEEVASEVMVWDPRLDMKFYRGLKDEWQKQVDACLTIKPGLPELELKPKNKDGKE